MSAKEDSFEEERKERRIMVLGVLGTLRLIASDMSKGNECLSTSFLTSSLPSGSPCGVRGVNRTVVIITHYVSKSIW